MEKTLSFFAVSPKGVVSILLHEIKGLGIRDAAASRSGVAFRGDLEAGYRACLWLRTASRVLLHLDRFQAGTPEELYQGVRRIPWVDHMAPEGSLAVDFNSSQSQIHHTRYGALKVKDAVVDQFRDQYRTRPSVDLARPDIRINVYLDRNEAVVSLDLSGESLHKRGYREEGGPAPLKETLAAAILFLAGWPRIAGRGGGLIDPMTGSGTLAIEAALMAGDVAPGLLREDFGFLRWKGHRPEIWEGLVHEARTRMAAGIKNLPPIAAYDSDSRAVRSALLHVERVGLRGAVHVEKRDLALLAPDHRMKDRPGLIILNPPYGERMGEAKTLRPLYAGLGQRLKTWFRGWRVGLFTGNAGLARELGVRAERTHTLYNGPIECRLLCYRIEPKWLARAEKPRPRPVPIGKGTPLDAALEMLANRLRKNLKRFRKAFQREGIECFRVYDRDLPEYAVAVDVYGEWVHVQEYKAPSSIDPQRAQARLGQALAVIGQVLDVPEDHIFFKVRQRQRGKDQYGKQGDRGVWHEVKERDLRFLVNFTDYIDTGLFLDYRMVRALIQGMAMGKRFLNLFCYTGTASVAAAKGGAISTVSVDASRVYLDWAKRNFGLNGLGLHGHGFYQADVFEWLRKEKRSYDIILVGPPTFSNSKRTLSVLDLQRDHAALIRSAARVLTKDGVIFFSTSYRKFRMDREGLKGFGLEDLSRATLPPDFERQSGRHHFWKITKTRTNRRCRPETR